MPSRAATPARLIRFRFPKEIVAELLEPSWWNYKVSGFAKLRCDDPVLFPAQLRQAAAGSITPYRPEKLVLGEFFATA